MRFYLTYLIVVLVIFCTPISGQNRPTVRDPKIDSIANPTLNPDMALSFDCPVQNFGTMSEDDSLKTFYFEFTNRGDKPIYVNKVSSSCGCVTASSDKQTVKTGERGSIVVIVNPKGYQGDFVRNIYIYTGNAENPSAKLTIKGYINPTADTWRSYRVVMSGQLRARNNTMRFSFASKEIQTERIECVNIGTTPLRLRAMEGVLPEHITFYTDPEVIQPNEVGDLVVTIDPSKLNERQRRVKQWQVIIDGLDSKMSQRTLYIATEFLN